MPSEDRINQALEALVDSKESFLSSVAMSAEEVRGILERQGSSEASPADKLAQELGPFAAGRIDLNRLLPFASGNSKMGDEKLVLVKKAYETLSGLKKGGDELFTVRCPLDGYLRGTILDGLARIGAAFGAARAVEWARTGIARPEGVEDPLKHFPPSSWNRREKGCAPPIVVEVEGQDLRAASLGELLDGSQKIILVVNGPAAPAPLVRLITPGVTVIQTDDPEDLATLAAAPGPGIAALMPDGCARFVHVGAPGLGLNDRLVVKHLPEKEPRRALGAISAFQQAEELRHLASLAGAVEATVVAEVEEGSANAAMDEPGQLAAWLIHQANLNEV